MTDYVIMPKADYQGACDAIRAKTGKTDLIKSGDMASEIDGISGGSVGGEDALFDAFAQGTIKECRSDTVTKIRRGAFAECIEITLADFPNATFVGWNAFGLCENLKEVKLPNAVELNGVTFDACARLEHIEIPKVIAIRNEVFWGCESLVTLDLPSAQSLGDYAFGSCYNLKTLILRSTATNWEGNNFCWAGADVLYDTAIEYGQGYIYVPRALLESYKTADNWSAYANQFRALEDYTVDGTITGELDMSKIGA